MTDQAQREWTSERILALLAEHRAELHAFGVRQIGVFGSYARNEQTPSSDVDLLFTMEPLTWAGWMDVWNLLEDWLALPVDLIPEKDLRLEIRTRILSEVRYVEGF